MNPTTRHTPVATGSLEVPLRPAQAAIRAATPTTQFRRLDEVTLKRLYAFAERAAAGCLVAHYKPDSPGL